MTKPQEIQFGSQPPKNAEVQFGKHPATTDTVTSSPGDSEPVHNSGIVPEYAGGDPVPAPDDDAA